MNASFNTAALANGAVAKPEVKYSPYYSLDSLSLDDVVFGGFNKEKSDNGHRCSIFHRKDNARLNVAFGPLRLTFGVDWPKQDPKKPDQKNNNISVCFGPTFTRYDPDTNTYAVYNSKTNALIPLDPVHETLYRWFQDLGIKAFAHVRKFRGKAKSSFTDPIRSSDAYLTDETKSEHQCLHTRIFGQEFKGSDKLRFKVELRDPKGYEMTLVRSTFHLLCESLLTICLCTGRIDPHLEEILCDGLS